MLRATLIAVAFLCGSHAAKADSDGYFCVGPDYLAYQLNSPGFPGAHKLFVIPFDGDQTEIIRYTTDLPDFQVHDIVCNEKHVRAIGWESVHDVTWDSDDPNTLKVTSNKKVYVPPQYDGRSLPLSLVLVLTRQFPCAIQIIGMSTYLKYRGKIFPSFNAPNW